MCDPEAKLPSLTDPSLVEKFFVAVDPIYPLLSPHNWYAEYNAFWLLTPAEKARVDDSFIALLLIMLATGTQFMRIPGDQSTVQEKAKTAEFYASACHQALRLGAYLNRASVRSLQAMVLMTYFLLNDNHASDGWAFGGILIRQAYAMGLNRDPSLLEQRLTTFQKQERRRLWIAIVCQDAFMSVILRLPPAATHADIDNASSLADGSEATSSPDSPGNGLQDEWFDKPADHGDIGYVQGMSSLAVLVQETISSPRSLSLPLAATPRHRTQLLARFRATYRTFPDIFRAWDETGICKLARHDNRIVRQILFLTSNYWHCVMLIQLEGAESLPDSAPAGANKEGNIRGTVEAAHEALKAFFVLRVLMVTEAGVWWVFCHRSFLQAVSHLSHFDCSATCLLTCSSATDLFSVSLF